MRLNLDDGLSRDQLIAELEKAWFCFDSILEINGNLYKTIKLLTEEVGRLKEVK